MPILAAISPWKLQRTAKLFFLGLFGVTVALIIGLRYEIGNDWFNYLNYYKTFIDKNNSTKQVDSIYAKIHLRRYQIYNRIT